MILTEKDIHKELEQGNILVHDGEKRVMSPTTVKWQSIDVRLWRWVYATVNGSNKWIDLDEGELKIDSMSTFVLAHTEEFIGTKSWSGILPTFKLKSTAGRLGIIHTLAWHGDIWFQWRWAMEFICAKPITLKRYMSIGQIYFTYCSKTDECDDYAIKWTYQNMDDIEKIVFYWNKEDILPPKELKVIKDIWF